MSSVCHVVHMFAITALCISNCVLHHRESNLIFILFCASDEPPASSCSVCFVANEPTAMAIARHEIIGDIVNMELSLAWFLSQADVVVAELTPTPQPANPLLPASARWVRQPMPRSRGDDDINEPGPSASASSSGLRR